MWALVRPWLRANDGGKVLQAEGRPWLADPGRNIAFHKNIVLMRHTAWKRNIVFEKNVVWKRNSVSKRSIAWYQKANKKYCIEEKYCWVLKG